MKLWFAVLLVVLVGSAAGAEELKDLLSPDNPTDRAILAYMALAQDKKAEPTELAELGVLLAQRGFAEEGEKYLKAAMKADKHDFQICYRYGLVLARLGKSQEATKAFKRALEQRPGDAYARFMLAMTEERGGRSKAAIKDYVLAFKLMPDLTRPEKNPLILDSTLRLQAQIQYYREVSGSTSFALTPINADQVKLMMEARPAATEPSPQVLPQATPAPQPVAIATPAPGEAP
jgi:tetratricopeptide (TPR) repeat protein